MLYELLGGPKFTLEVLRPLDAPWRKNFYTQDEYFGISNYVFNFNFVALAVSEILGGLKFTLGALHPLDAHLVDKSLYAMRVLHNI